LFFIRTFVPTMIQYRCRSLTYWFRYSTRDGCGNVPRD